MANTYTLIASNTLGSSAASVTFSAIPQTYTDLVLRVSARSSTTNNAQVSFNGVTTNRSYTMLRGESTVGNERGASMPIIGLTTSDFTANTFNSYELYFPSYTAANFKPLSSIGTEENNSSSNFENRIAAALWSDTSAITSITINGGDFVSGSSFYLYGIKNS